MIDNRLTIIKYTMINVDVHLLPHKVHLENVLPKNAYK